MQSYISSWVAINNKVLVRNGITTTLTDNATLEDIYRQSGISYPKFFKMDELCKLAFLGAENLLISDNALLYNGLDSNKIAVVIATSHGCLEVDRKYDETLRKIPSPSLFVYTLPNIMLGEIAIRHVFKGEQCCLVNEVFDENELHFYVNDLLANRNMDACICGWVNAVNGNRELNLFWIGKNINGVPCTPQKLKEIYTQYKN